MNTEKLVIQYIVNYTGDNFLETLDMCVENRSINEAIFQPPLEPGESYSCLFIAHGVQVAVDIYHYGSGAYRILKIADETERRKRIRKYNKV